MHTAFGFDLGANECVYVAIFCLLLTSLLWGAFWAGSGWLGGWVTAD